MSESGDASSTFQVIASATGSSASGADASVGATSGVVGVASGSGSGAGASAVGSEGGTSGVGGSSWALALLVGRGLLGRRRDRWLFGLRFRSRLFGVRSEAGAVSSSRISIGLLASESRRQVTFSPSSHSIFTDTALAQTMRPSTPSSVQRTRLPIRSAGRFAVFVVAGLFFFSPCCFSLFFRLFFAGGATCAAQQGH